jgi:undecaprenyl pyrophosphate synthase
MTLYAFSRETWARSDDEVIGCFGLLEAAIRSETEELRAQGGPDPADRAARRTSGGDAPLDR